MDFITRARQQPLRPLRLPPQFENVTRAGIQHPTVHDLVTRYLTNFWDAADQGIAPVFCGKVGTYKTYGSCVIAKAVYEKLAVTVEYFDTPTEVPQLDRGWYDGTTTRRMDQLCKAPLLIVDDFARLRPTGRDIAIMDEIGQLRYNSGLPTIWTANIEFGPDKTAIADLIGAAFERRLVERSAGYRTYMV